MKRVIKKLLFNSVLLISVMSVNAQLLQHGLVINGGTGVVTSNIDRSKAKNQDWGVFEYRFGFSVGYRLRYQITSLKSLHFDLDPHIGQKFLKVKYYKQNKPNNYDYGYGNHNFASIGGTANYFLIKNLIVGFGVEPTYYFDFMRRYESYNKFDIPVVAKIAYNLRFVEIGIAGKYGLTNVLKSDTELYSMTSGKIHDIHLSLFFPFRR